jgi:CheY-like chemotaxis protein
MRALRRARPLKGIALSGYGTEADVQACKEAGFSAHLTKPVDFERLLATLREVARPA